MDKLIFYMQYPFVRYALIVGVLISLCSSLLGVTLVLKRFSYIGDGLSHVAFGGIAIASVANLSNRMILVLPITIISAILLLRTGQNTRIRGDAAIAMISVGALAFGYLFMNLFGTSSNLTGDVCTTLFGSTSILTLTMTDVWLCVVMSVVVLITFIMFYNKIFAVTFDEGFAKAVGTNAERYNLIIAVIIAIVIVLAMNLVGSLLISALIIFPALSAMRLFASFKKVTVFSAVFSVICAVTGIIISILGGTPVGSTIVAVDAVGFGICCAASGLRKTRLIPVAAMLLLMIVAFGCGTEEYAEDEMSVNSASSVESTGNNIEESIDNRIEESTDNRIEGSTGNSIKESIDNGTEDSTDNSTEELSEDTSGDTSEAQDTSTVDLTVLSSTMVYAEVYQMMCYPDQYVGRTVKMQGLYDSFHDDASGKDYYACIIKDATACCAQGIEFVLEDGNYPPLDTEEITVEGTFSLYEENNEMYCTLANARLVD